MQVFKFFIIIVLLASSLYFFKDRFAQEAFKPQSSILPTNGVEVRSESKNIEIVATGLNIPWEIAFLPSNEMLVTERGGKLLKISQTTKLIAEISGVKHTSEGGLLGLAIDPNFKTNKFIYLYSTTLETDSLSNRVERYKLENDKLFDRFVILEDIKGSSNHDGGRIAFGPDGYLYITTGDAEFPSLAQDKNSLNGKILRIKSDGSIPLDNPFNNAVYSYGHRNPQGLAWDNNGNLWAIEHGPSGYDEVNKIIKGNNYGWPEIKGNEVKNGMVVPVIDSGNDTWAPSGMVYLNEKLYFTGLRGEALYQLNVEIETNPILQTSFKSEFGRLRAITTRSDGYIYLSTSNKDGRGRLKDGDDKIIRIKI